MTAPLTPEQAMATLDGPLPTGEPIDDPNGYTADRAALEKHTGLVLPEEIFDFEPWGTRIVVAHVPSERRIGMIWVPEVAKQKVAQGWVVSVGARVGKGRYDYVGWCPCPPRELLGAKVVFGQYAGQTLKTGAGDDDYDSGWSILTENECWGAMRSSFPAEPLPLLGDPNE